MWLNVWHNATLPGPGHYLVVSLHRGPQYRLQTIIVPIIGTIGTPTKVPLILGNPHMSIAYRQPTAEVRGAEQERL